MYGILTADAHLARRDVGDATYYVAEGADGRRRDPLAGAVNSVACWGDSAAVREDPARAAVAAAGTRATPDAEGHHWGTVCPTDPGYRAALLDRIERAGAAGDVRLATVGFPGEEFCRCDRCTGEFAASEFEDRDAWRAAVVSAFVADAADRVAGDLLVTLYPDPYPGNLRERAGLDPHALAPHVDGFVVPLCGFGYETTYWVEALARGFARELDGLAPLTVQLSAVGAAADRLVGLTRQVDPHADAVVYGTRGEDGDVVRETIGRVREAEPATATG